MIRNYPFRFFVIFTVLILFAIYFPVTNVGFYLDDFDSILNNPIIQAPTLAELNQWYPMRQIGYASIALDFHFFGTEPGGYHVTNVVLHGFVVLALYWLCHLLILAVGAKREEYWYLPMLVALTFAILPINSQAVVYAIQRLAIISSLFYILAMCCFLKFRLSPGSDKWKWLICVFLCFAIGMHVKQNTATLPLAIFILEVTLFKGWIRQKAIAIITLGVAFGLVFHVIDFLLGAPILNRIDAFTKETSDISRWEYLTHQFYVHWLYIGKFLVPYPLRLEYSTTLLNWSNYQVWMGLALTIFSIVAAYRVRLRFPLIYMSVLLYFCLHLVESGLIPIRDLVFEHRAYLPNIALCIIFAVVMTYLFSRYRKGTTLVVVGLFSWAIMTTHMRVKVWADPIEFYRHEMTYLGDKARIYGSLATKFAEKGDRANAIRWFRIALQVGQETGILSANTVIAYIDILNNQGEEGRAKYLGIKAINAARRWQDKADILAVIAKLDVAQGQCKDAMGMINRALRYHPGNIAANNLKRQCELQLRKKD